MQVQVVSDVVCPWCRIGKHNLKKAADQFTSETGEPVEITFIPFLLDPIRPEEEGEGFRERFVQRKGLSEAQMDEMFQRVTQVGAQFGLPFHFENVKVAANTVPAHELMELAPAEKRWDLMDALMKGYFEDGKNPGDIDTLLEIARSVLGNEATQELEPALRERKMQPLVMAAIQQAQQSGVQGVPFTIVDNKFGVNGGQPPDVFLGALKHAWDARQAEQQPEAE